MNLEMMRYPEFHYRWEWMLDAEAEALWPLVADTNRFNRDTGVPTLERQSDTEPLTNARVLFIRFEQLLAKLGQPRLRELIDSLLPRTAA